MDVNTEDFWNRTDTVGQLRVHYLLEEHFALESANARSMGIWKKAACLLALAGLSVAIWMFAKPSSSCLQVELVETSALSSEDLEMCKARYMSAQSFVRPSAVGLVKYEPDSIANPGTPIKVMEADSEADAGHRLHAGDYVWRQELVQTSGKLRFAVGDGCEVTMLGPAEVRLRDSSTIEVVSGSILIDASSHMYVSYSGQCVAIDQASVAVVARRDGQSLDLIVTDGLVLMGPEMCLRPCEGVRMGSDGSLKRYRSLVGGGCLRDTIMAGISDIRINERRGHDLWP